MTIRALIFDLDGVIVDTAKYHYIAWREIARELGFRFTEKENERLKGVSRMQSLDILLQVGGLQLTQHEKEQLAEKKNAHYLTYIERMTAGEVLPGVLPFLAEAKEMKLRMALGSASKNAPLILEKTMLSPFFDCIVDGNDVNAAKPDPEVFLKAAQLLETEPEECLVFEDAEAGVEAARRAGMWCVGIGSPQVLSAANLVIPGFSGFSVRDILEKFNSK